MKKIFHLLNVVMLLSPVSSLGAGANVFSCLAPTAGVTSPDARETDDTLVFSSPFLSPEERRARFEDGRAFSFDLADVLSLHKSRLFSTDEINFLSEIRDNIILREAGSDFEEKIEFHFRGEEEIIRIVLRQEYISDVNWTILQNNWTLWNTLSDSEQFILSRRRGVHFHGGGKGLKNFAHWPRMKRMKLRLSYRHSDDPEYGFETEILLYRPRGTYFPWLTRNIRELYRLHPDYPARSA
jgi:hypothetical protein